MKRFIILVVALLLSINVKSQNSLKEQYGIILKYDTSESGLANYICASYYGSLSAPVPIVYLEKAIMRGIGLDENHSDRRKIVGKFLNEYHGDLICGNDNSQLLRENEPLIKRSIGRGEFALIDHLMIFEEDYQYNLNHYEIVDGKKETILDYIEKILNNPILLKHYNEDALRILHNDFIEYEAKRGSEL
ncbi:hypothetical protein [Algibacter lectus]|uniref:hypothetical protein n=1 Tax=Algibacter lectus TaxID=221126 RepID=UPI0024952744|nr:hypothetical protein [Algibacter lectus]